MTVPHSVVSGWIREVKQGMPQRGVQKVDMKRAVAKAKQTGTFRKESNKGAWKATKQRAAKKAEVKVRPPAVTMATAPRTVAEFLGRDQIGFRGNYKPTLLKRGGLAVTPPKEWSQREVAECRQRDLALVGRAQGTWDIYTRWWGVFEAYAWSQGHLTSEWDMASHEDAFTCVVLLRGAVEEMEPKYAYATVSMMVTAVSRAAQDFGWGSLREDGPLKLMLDGLKNLKGVNARKMQAVLGEHIVVIMTLRKPHKVCLLFWCELKAIILTGWMAFLRVSELLGMGYSWGMEQGKSVRTRNDGPVGLDVCDITWGDVWMVFHVRNAKNDQAMEGFTTVVYENKEEQRQCALNRVKEWMSMADLRVSARCTKGQEGCGVCRRRRCICDCRECGKLFRSVTHGKVRENAMARDKLTQGMRMMYGLLEGQGVVPEGTVAEISGISLRAGGVTVGAAAGLTRDILAGHGRWKSESGPEHYDRGRLEKFKVVSEALQAAMTTPEAGGRKPGVKVAQNPKGRATC